MSSSIDLDDETFHKGKEEQDLEKRLEKSLKIQERINMLLKKRISKQQRKLREKSGKLSLISANSPASENSSPQVKEQLEYGCKILPQKDSETHSSAAETNSLDCKSLTKTPDKNKVVMKDSDLFGIGKQPSPQKESPPKDQPMAKIDV